MTSFPTSLKTFTQIADGIDYPQATQLNQAYDEIQELEKLLGINGVGWIGEGRMYNGKLSVTVSANDLIVALKTMAGTDPSTTDPVYFRINGTIRKCTAALSKTLADGTNWFNSGSVELGTKEIDYFVYAIWNTTPATDIIDLGFARVPYFSVYSEASGTTTNEKYLAFANASTPTSTNDMVNIGRFAATLSLTGTGHLWTVPTFTTDNLIQRPVYETRWLTYQPAYSANGAMTYTTVTTNTARYKLDEETVDVWVSATGTTGGTANTQILNTLPFEALQVASTPQGYGSAASVAARVSISAGTPDTMITSKYDVSNYALSAGITINIQASYEV